MDGSDHSLDDSDRRRIVLAAIRRVEREPSLLGSSPHFMAIATKPRRPQAGSGD